MSMKKKIISLWALTLPLLLNAQVIINVVQPPAGMITKDQLWNLVLTNSGNTTTEVTILMNLKDAKTGQSVLSAGTRSILLNKGTKVLTNQDIQPVQYNYGAPGLAENFLPLGSYIACYTVSKYSHESMSNIATECVRLNITPLSPPLLNTPANKAVLQSPAPQLTWTPPTPVNMFDNLTYSVRVTEVMEGQAPSEAIVYNTPLFTSANSKMPYENYSSAYSKLQPGKTYAWQVIANNGDNYAAATEVWTFSVAADATKSEPTDIAYISLSSNATGSGVYYITGNELRVKYYSFDKTHESVVRLLEAGGKVVQEVKRNVIYGDNFLTLSLNRLFNSNKVYTIEIIDQQKRSSTASFSIK
jgi:hypothetical protein